MVATTDISILAFVFMEASLQDGSNLFSTCLGMGNAFILRYRFKTRQEDSEEVTI